MPSKIPDSSSPARWPGYIFLVGPNPHYSRAQVCEWILSTTQPLYGHPRGQGLSWCRGRSPSRRIPEGAAPSGARPCVPSRLLIRWRGAPWTQFLCLPLAGSHITSYFYPSHTYLSTSLYIPDVRCEIQHRRQCSSISYLISHIAYL